MFLEHLLHKFPQMNWEITFLKNNKLKATLSSRAKKRKYPIRNLRYWFINQFLQNEYLARSAPLTICEVGIDSGQMLQFVNSVRDIKGRGNNNLRWSSWVGVDCCVKKNKVDSLGYTKLIQLNIEESSNWITNDYDIIIMLHTLEHLYYPETMVAKIAQKMKPNSVLVGGFPSVPHWCEKFRESKIRKNPHFVRGHVSVFSSTRIKKIAKNNRLQLEFISGAYFMRSSGFFLEDYAWWLRINLLFGALFPSWPGEIYWIMRKSSK
jgi:SAM-dependent methyltransferase|tara:strand:- start:540 stop:1334 length:795 start_codon:yes stop_codon:yes gene_type:complete